MLSVYLDRQTQGDVRMPPIQHIAAGHGVTQSNTRCMYVKEGSRTWSLSEGYVFKGYSKHLAIRTHRRYIIPDSKLGMTMLVPSGILVLYRQSTDYFANMIVQYLLPVSS